MHMYTIFNWDISETTPPHEKAVMGTPKEPGDQARQVWYVSLTDAEVVGLSDRYDVMILGARTENLGSRKHPHWVEYPSQIRLCEKGRRFRSY